MAAGVIPGIRLACAIDCGPRYSAGQGSKNRCEAKTLRNPAFGRHADRPARRVSFGGLGQYSHNGSLLVRRTSKPCRGYPLDAHGTWPHGFRFCWLFPLPEKARVCGLLVGMRCPGKIRSPRTKKDSSSQQRQRQSACRLSRASE